MSGHAADGAPERPADRPAPISLRLVAAVVDYTITMVLAVAAVALGTSFGSESAGNVVALVLVAAYPIVAVGAYDRTVGKRLCNLVVRASSGGRPGWVRSVVRFVVTVAPFVVATLVRRGSDDDSVTPTVVQLVLALVVYGPIVADRRRRGLHDRLAGTVVVSTVTPLAGVIDQLMARALDQAANRPGPDAGDDRRPDADQP